MNVHLNMYVVKIKSVQNLHIVQLVEPNNEVELINGMNTFWNMFVTVV